MERHGLGPPRVHAPAVEDREPERDPVSPRRQGVVETAADRAVFAEEGERGETFHFHGARGQPGAPLTLPLRPEIRSPCQRQGGGALECGRVHGDVAQTVGQFERDGEFEVHGAQQLHVGAAAGGGGNQQPLPVVGQLHAGAGDLDAGGGPRRLPVLGQRQHPLGEGDVGAGRVQVRVGPDG